MGHLHDFATKHHTFVQNIDSYIESVIDDNQYLLNLNKEQLKEEHKNAKDQFNSPKYSAGYAQKKGFTITDLYNSGDMFKSMTIEAKSNKFEIKADTDYVPDLMEKYGADIFGIAPSMQPKAKQITTKELTKQYKASCYTK